MPVPENLKPRGRGRGSGSTPPGQVAWPIRPVMLVGAVVAAGFLVAMTFLFLVVAAGNAAQHLSEQLRCTENNKPIKLSLPKVAQRSSIFASDGTLMATLYLENRKVVRLANVAPIARKAILAIEDYQFYQHGGVDLK